MAAAADPESETYEPLIFEDEPLLVEGATVEGALIEPEAAPIAGKCPIFLIYV